MLLKNKIALVTGSTQNIARQGAKVVVHSRHEVDARKVAQEINGDFYTADVVDAAQVAAMFEPIKKTHGRLDILVNNMAHSTKGGILDITLEEWNRILAINLTGYFLCIQHAGRMMYAQGTAALSISPLVPASARVQEARPMR
jgi:NAD(P)-dependent dehydrogenase (short-subunit alcohol dehydrogenase family)